jgi:2'-5' RNA ligase
LLERLERRYDEWLWQQPGQTALVVPVPEAESLVGPLRREYTSSGAAGMPAHVTVLAPFAPVSELNADHERAVRELAADHDRFAFVLERVNRFPDGTVYLEPVPAEPFTGLIRAFAGRFPEHPPYMGAFPDPVPHLTVGREDDRCTTPLGETLSTRLPLAAEARAIALFQRAEDARWRQRTRFPLGARAMSRSA